VTSQADTSEQDSAGPAFGKAYMWFMGLTGAVFAVIAVAIPMVILASSFTEGPRGAEAASSTDSPTSPGEAVAVAAGCVSCHTADGAESVGPTWLGLAGIERELEGGASATVDSAYLTKSIVDPAAQLAAGYDDLMPKTYADDLTDEEIADLVEYIESLG